MSRCSLLAALVLASAAHAAEVTTVTLTDKVVVKDTVPFGINLGGDAYYSGAALVKKRSVANFEGTSYRQCHFGPKNGDDGMSTWFRNWGSWDEILVGGRFTVLSGPGKGITGTIKEVTRRPAKHRGEVQQFRYFVFDRKVPVAPPNAGVMVETMRLRDGQFRPLDGYWTSKKNRVVIGDVPPGSFGCAAACLDATEDKKAHLRFSTHYQRYGQTNGTWHVRFWAKRQAGSPKLRVTADREEWGESRNVAVADAWAKHAVALVVSKVPEPKGPRDNPHLLFRFEVTGGAVLLDDVEIWMEGDTNPTVFRDDCVAMLKEFRPGCLRYLQMGGSTIENTIAAPLRSHTYASQNSAKVGPYQRHRRDPYSLHEMYELCEHLGCEPWYCLPGTLHQDEMKRFLEYLGAPPDVGLGKLRAELGHPKPWTEVFDHIHVEFGNEAWNNAGPYQCGGFNGADYWRDLIAVGKSSPYYRKHVVFHAGGQAANSWLTRGLLPRFPNADCLALAPYILHNFSKEEAEALDTDEKLFRWAFAYPIWRSLHKDGAMLQQDKLTGEAGMGISVYEVNHHITGGDGPLEPRNRIVTSIGGGLNVANNMLLHLREHGARFQCLFSLAQHGYRAKAGVVRLWGTALCMRKGKERYRPTFLACAAANQAIGGDLVETRHSGASPTFSATGKFRWRKPAETIKDLPCLWSYAFADGKRRGLILINLDTAKAHPVAIQFAGDVADEGAQSWLLTADRITASNEYEAGEPQVRLVEERLADFRSGSQVSVPPFSLRVLRWEMR